MYLERGEKKSSISQWAATANVEPQKKRKIENSTYAFKTICHQGIYAKSTNPSMISLWL